MTDRPRSWAEDLQFAVLPGEDPAGRGVAAPWLALPGSDHVRPSILLTWSDMLAGMVINRATFPDVFVTVDLGARLVAPVAASAPVRAGLDILKRGRTTTVAEVRFWTGPTLFATSLSTFTRSPRPADVHESMVWMRPQEADFRPSEPPDRPLAEHVGVRVMEVGVAEVALGPELHNTSGGLMGGMVALLAEEAARSWWREGRRLVEIDARYLSAVRVGPARATAVLDGPDLARVAVHDEGRDGRLAALIHVRAEP
jgi:acyl-coenzyme A thioesterase PaaI-like protein